MTKSSSLFLITRQEVDEQAPRIILKTGLKLQPGRQHVAIYLGLRGKQQFLKMVPVTDPVLRRRGTPIPETRQKPIICQFPPPPPPQTA